MLEKIQETAEYLKMRIPTSPATGIKVEAVEICSGYGHGINVDGGSVGYTEIVWRPLNNLKVAGCISDKTNCLTGYVIVLRVHRCAVQEQKLIAGIKREARCGVCALI